MQGRLKNHFEFQYDCFEKGLISELHERNCENLDYAIDAYPEIQRSNITDWVTGSGMRLAAGLNDVAYFEKLHRLATLLANDGFTVGILGPNNKRQLLDDVVVLQVEREMMNRLVGLSEELGEVSGTEFIRAAKERKIKDPARLLIWLERVERVNIADNTIRPGAAGGYGPTGVPILYWKGDIHYTYQVDRYDRTEGYLDDDLSLERTPLTSLTEEQCTFYEKFAFSLARGEWISIDGQWEYGHVYVASLLRRNLADLVTLRSELNQIRELYPYSPFADHAGRTLAETYLLDRDYASYYECLFDSGTISAEEFVLSSRIIDRQPSLAELLRWDLRTGVLTSAFENRFDEATVEVELALRAKFPVEGALKQFLVGSSNQRIGASPNGLTGLLAEDEIGIFPDEPSVFQVVKTPHISRPSGTYGYAVDKMLIELYREAENTLRKRDGLPLVGQGWINETRLYKLVEQSFPEHKVVHQGRPEWLGRQSLDIYLPDFNIGIEYQGIQHYKPVSIFGGEDGLVATQARDAMKRELCHTYGCVLIEVQEGYDPDQFVAGLRLLIDERLE